MLELLSYPFIIKALIVGVMVSLCSSLLGVSLVLKRYSMIGDGLSHVGFGALSVAAAANLSPLYVSIPIVLIAAVLLLRISENSKIKGDAAIAMISSSALAIGIIINSISRVNIDLNNYMFGSILAVRDSDVLLSVILSIIVIAMFVILYNRIFLVTFDPSFASATGINVKRYNLLIAVLTAFVVVLGMRLMGTLLISSLIIFPTLSSMRLFGVFKYVTICSAVMSVVCFLVGMIASFYLSIPTGAAIVVVNLIVFGLFSLIGNLDPHANS